MAKAKKRKKNRKSKNQSQAVVRDRPPQETIQRMLDYIPEYYETHDAFVESRSRLNQDDLRGSLEKLIDLTKAFDHYFSAEFWSGLAAAATKLGMENQAVFCHAQMTDAEAKGIREAVKAWADKSLSSIELQ